MTLTAQVGLGAVPSTKSYRLLHNQVVARPGASIRLARLRVATLAEVGLFKLLRGLYRRSSADDRG